MGCLWGSPKLVTMLQAHMQWKLSTVPQKSCGCSGWQHMDTGFGACGCWQLGGPPGCKVQGCKSQGVIMAWQAPHKWWQGEAAAGAALI